MFRNRWISNYVGAIKYCGEGFESEASIRFENSRLLQRRALSFQKELSFEDKEQLCKSTQDIDANILAVLPKVSELRKRFEPESHTALEMNRKERIARRLEAIESDTQLQSCPGLVSHRLLEEDTPRYTRANDPCSPCAARRFSKEELNIQESEDPSSERQSRARCRAEPQSIHTESTYSTGSMETAGTDSKAERIARYKAERRRQLAERYGISLDHELESDFSPKYPRMRKEPEALAQHAQASQNRKEQEEQDRELSSLYSTRTGFVREPKIMQSKENAFRESVDCFSDQERMMNLENYKRAQDPGAQTGVYGKPLFMDVSTTTTVPGKDFSAGEVPGSPRHGRQSSLQSPQQSPGDLFIEHQAQNILSRQGEAEVELTTTGLDSASKTERERGARRPRRYISPGENRKTSERFRTQPITSSERLESDRSHLSPENNEADEEKLDERAKMSVAAKRSLFRELEKSIDSAPVPKPRSRNAAVERRLRRTQDRSRTQPVTTEEVVIAATVPAPASQTVTVHTTVARIPSPTVVSTSVQRISLQASSQQKALAREQAREGATEEQGPEEPDLSTLSLSEKMALFNRLSQTSTKVASRSRADLRQRRVNTRYQTQPITLGEVEQEIEPQVPPPVAYGIPEYLQREMRSVQLQNGARGKIGPLSPSIVKSVAAAASQAATLSTTSAGELQLGRSKAVREESLSSTQRLYNRSIPKHHSTAASADPSVKSVAAPELKPLHLTTEKQQQQQPEITGVFQSYSVAEQRPAELRGAVAQESSSKVKHRSTEWGGKQKQQQQQPPAQPSGSERDAEIRELRHDAARRSSRELPTEPQGFLRSESAAVLERQEARGVLRERQPLQDPFESESVQKSKTVVSELLEPTASLRAVSATARSASRTSNVLPSILQPSELTEDRGYGVQSELISAKENQAETSEELPDSMSSRQMSIKDRLALLKKSGEEDWRNRINKKQDAVKVVVSEHQSQLWEVKQSFKKKVTGPGAEKKENNHPENYT
ncbi:supervillin-like isoform X6 [Polyodon spathula]|uniref:supervillin-like isoform X6 n=1 Tax=Polyodon spathula TaxID=7913 RepID=UPI001B7F18E7|nr:supervillin-like isoform X6 [Polyodon spathula]